MMVDGVRQPPTMEGGAGLNEAVMTQCPLFLSLTRGYRHCRYAATPSPGPGGPV
jgi:hypothetical protein